MEIRWLGHACFQYTFEDGTRLVTDPYGEIGYPALDLEAEVVTVSHGHFDHNEVKAVKGNPKVVDQAGTHHVAGLTIIGVNAFHDKSHGSERGPNVIYVVEGDGLRVAHLGDLGHELEDIQVEKMGKIDIMITPVGGHYTIDADQAYRNVERMNPSVIIPMHFKTPAINFPIAGVEGFLNKFPGHEDIGSNRVEINRKNIFGNRRIIVLDYE
jgi:L-ascorbate metabolism protein UlaG (beta-lactamase superfamily)